jgi:hypothetical protein
VTSVAQFRSAASRHLPGERVTLQCWDPGKGTNRTFSLQLVAKDLLERK